MKYDIPVIMSVEANTIEEARQRAYKAVEVINEPFVDDGEAINKAMPGITLDMADDSATNRINQRIVFLHPENVDNAYDIDAYNAKLEEDKED